MDPPGEKTQSSDERIPAAPAISLPRGGGAIRGIGEKFAANPVSGTASMSVPIATSPGRSGFGPQLALSYDSGSGNGPFGFGWTLGTPSIRRKTDKGLPRYRDGEESDVFVLSGAEDLVPVLDGEQRFEDRTREAGYTIHRYRPRVEGLFARIERWSDDANPHDVHWRTISGDNVLTIYGKDAASRIVDPEDPTRIFEWLVCETRDDKGNAVVYEYKADDGAGVDLTRAHERNRGERGDLRRTTNRYLKRIRYGNREPLLNSAGRRPRSLAPDAIGGTDWLFETVFDYGEHDTSTPTPAESRPWDLRADPFSSYRSGFEIRTTRLCQRVLMFHHFPDEPGVGADCLVRSTDFTYSHEQEPTSARNPVYTFLREVTQLGYRRESGGYLTRRMPPVEFGYTQPEIEDRVEEVDADSLDNLPIGLDGEIYRWTDLHGEGIAGVLTEQAGQWFYKRNRSPLHERRVELGPLERVAQRPNLALASGARFVDLAGDGQPDLVTLESETPGFYEHDDREGWRPFRPFGSRLGRDMRDPNLRFVDLSGDGRADVLITEDEAFVWHPSIGEEGYGSARRVAQALDEEKGPRLVFADGTQSIHLADLGGDGLADLVRIRGGEICYWPNLGYGRFGAKVTMDNAPRLDQPDRYDPGRVRLADIDGSGTTDVIYLHGDGVRLYFNQSGNSWSEPRVLDVFPRVDDVVNITPVDLQGNGTACLLWSSPLPQDARRPMRYVRLMGAKKPHLLVSTVNNLGAETRVEYAPSTKFYLRDKQEGRPWLTRLPFPVHVVERVTTYDHLSGNRFGTRYAYHHGHFDGEEREFRGFGMVERWDTESLGSLADGASADGATNLDRAYELPPVHTRTWFHTGVYLGRNRVSDFFAGLLDTSDRGEYYREPGASDVEARALLLPDTLLPEGLTADEEREACRALRGSMLRQEVYANDRTPKAPHPYTVTEQNYTIRVLQRRGANPHAVFLAHPREAITYHYERNPEDPRFRHALTLAVDPYGNVLREAAIGYGRRRADEALPDDVDRLKQTRTLVTCSRHLHTRAIDDVATHPDDYRTPLPCETRTYELSGLKPGNGSRFGFDEWARDDFALAAGATEIAYDAVDFGYRESAVPTTTPTKRLIEHVRTLYRSDDCTAMLPLREIEPLALPGESYRLALTPGLLARVFRRDDQALLPDAAAVLGAPGGDGGGYVSSQSLRGQSLFPDAADHPDRTPSDDDGHWWISSGRVFLSPDGQDTPAQELAHARNHFFLPRRFRDPFDAPAFGELPASTRNFSGLI